MNKRAQTALMLIPLIAIALALAALFAFASFGNKIGKQSEELSRLMEEVIFQEQYIIVQAKLILEETIESCSGCDISQLNVEFKNITKQKEELFRYKPAENFYGKVHREEFEIKEEDGSYALLIEGVFTEAEVGENRIRRNFDIIQNIYK